MRKVLITVATGLSVLLLTQCAEKTTPVAKTTTTPTEEVAAVKAKYTPQQIAGGKAISANSCGECHEEHQPGELTVKEWDDILPKMSRKAKLSSADAATLYAWMVTNAKSQG